MTPAQLAGLWQAETIKLFSRSSARFGLVIAVAVGLLGPIALQLIGRSSINFNGAPLSESWAEYVTSPNALRWALSLRNAYVMHAFAILVGAQSFAGEFAARTLREDLLRPVPRWSVLLAKWLALDTWIGIGLLLTWIVGGVLSVVLFGFSGPDWDRVILGYLAAFASDCGWVALVLTVSVFLRSIGSTIVGVFLFLLLDSAIGWLLYAAAKIGAVPMLRDSLGDQAVWFDRLAQVQPWMPSSALGIAQCVWPGNPWMWQNFVALGLLTAGSLAIAHWRFSTLDVP